MQSHVYNILYLTCHLDNLRLSYIGRRFMRKDRSVLPDGVSTKFDFDISHEPSSTLAHVFVLQRGNQIKMQVICKKEIHY